MLPVIKKMPTARSNKLSPELTELFLTKKSFSSIQKSVSPQLYYKTCGEKANPKQRNNPQHCDQGTSYCHFAFLKNLNPHLKTSFIQKQDPSIPKIPFQALNTFSGEIHQPANPFSYYLLLASCCNQSSWL